MEAPLKALYVARARLFQSSTEPTSLKLPKHRTTIQAAVGARSSNQEETDAGGWGLACTRRRSTVLPSHACTQCTPCCRAKCKLLSVSILEPTKTSRKRESPALEIKMCRPADAAPTGCKGAKSRPESRAKVTELRFTCEVWSTQTQWESMLRTRAPSLHEWTHFFHRCLCWVLSPVVQPSHRTLRFKRGLKCLKVIK